MGNQTIVNLLMILAGAIVMLVSILRYQRVIQTLPFVPERHRERIQLYLFVHRGLMVVFLIGYLSVTGAIALKLPLFSETFISIIFLLGAIYVFIGIVIQSRLLTEVQSTLQGIVPICAQCKKVMAESGDPGDLTIWKNIEAYIADRTDANFTHSVCPECAKALYPGMKLYHD